MPEAGGESLESQKPPAIPVAETGATTDESAAKRDPCQNGELLEQVLDFAEHLPKKPPKLEIDTIFKARKNTD